MGNVKWVAALAFLGIALSVILMFMGEPDAFTVAVLAVALAVLSLHER